MDDLRKLAHDVAVRCWAGAECHNDHCNAIHAALVRAVDGALLDAIRVVIEAPMIMLATGGVFIGQESTTEKLRVLRAKIKGTP